jgi:hypothetical protein
MSKLAIKGKEYSKEVIEILEMLGGRNAHEYNGYSNLLYYYINEDGIIDCDKYIEISFSCIRFTLEEFFAKYPYKVGDKVVVKGLSEYPKSIHFMKWFDDNIHYSFDNETWFLPSALNSYK